MLGLFGDPSALEGLVPDRVYRNIKRLAGWEAGIIPFVWVPKAGPEAAVEDVYGRRSLFAFNNSGCILSPQIRRRVKDLASKAVSLGYRELMLDALRLPSPVDGSLFLSACFCSYSLARVPELGHISSTLRRALVSSDADLLLEALEHMAWARSRHVEAFLDELAGHAEKLGLRLLAAVFPYPLSRYLGQDPGVLHRYLEEVHVMLYHKCGGAACLNAELDAYARTLLSMGFDRYEAAEIIGRTTGLRLSEEELHVLGKGISLTHIEELAEINRAVYGDRFIPIVWLDRDTRGRIRGYLSRHRSLDVFAPRSP